MNSCLRPQLLRKPLFFINPACAEMVSVTNEIIQINASASAERSLIRSTTWRPKKSTRDATLNV